MTPARLILRAAVYGLMFFAVCSALADTIVLKNGRRISAMNVTEEGEKVRYETPAGQLTLPKSIVDHIEKDGYGYAGTTASAAAALAIAPPADVNLGGSAEVGRGAVHDGAVDRSYIAGLEGQVRGGGREAGERAAYAHHVAAQFEASRGEMDRALADERTALTYATEQPVLLMDVAYMHLRRSEFKESLDYLDRARRVSPDNADVAKLAGWAWYGLNNPDRAVAEWKHAYALRPDADTRAALDKATRDKAEEESYRENESSHFNLKYSGTAEPGLARDVLHTLEAHYAAIESELNFSPPDSIGVILYTQQAFTDITRAPSWAGALNDGRIRVPVQGLTSVSPELSRVLKHELTHSFVRQKTRGRAPTWLQEGLAQWMEGKRSDENAAVLVRISDEGHAQSLGELEGSWLGLPSGQAAYAYAWALANVEYIVQRDGMGDIERILDRIAAGESAEAALRAVLHTDYADLMLATSEYLKKTYLP